MLLYIVRHAWAEERDDEKWPDDDHRPLTRKGQERFAEIVRLLVRRGMPPEIIATSPLVRCRQTAEILAAGLDRTPKVVERPELIPDSDLEGILSWTARESRQFGAIAWVGHAPDVGWLTAALIGDSRAAIDFSKGAIAAIEFDGEIQTGRGTLCWLVNAKVLGI